MHIRARDALFQSRWELIHLGLTEATASLEMPSMVFQEYVLALSWRRRGGTTVPQM